MSFCSDLAGQWSYGYTDSRASSFKPKCAGSNPAAGTTISSSNPGLAAYGARPETARLTAIGGQEGPCSSRDAVGCAGLFAWRLWIAFSTSASALPVAPASRESDAQTHNDRPVVWVSEGGADWRRSWTGQVGQELEGIAAIGDGFLAYGRVRSQPSGLLVTSLDGTGWESDLADWYDGNGFFVAGGAGATRGLRCGELSPEGGHQQPAAGGRAERERPNLGP